MNISIDLDPLSSRYAAVPLFVTALRVPHDAIGQPLLPVDRTDRQCTGGTAGGVRIVSEGIRIYQPVQTFRRLYNVIPLLYRNIRVL